MKKITKLKYYTWRFTYGAHIIKNRIFKSKFKITKCGKRMLLSGPMTNEKIKVLLLDKKPFMVARFGSVEMQTINRYIRKGLKIIDDYEIPYYNQLHYNAGFFPYKNMELTDKFAEMMLSYAKEVDLLGMFADKSENLVVNNFMPNTELARLNGLEPYYYTEPWSAALIGKKVLVIHPFEKSIISQYKKRELLFEDKTVLPKFELLTLKAVQTIAGTKSEFSSWFDALDFMTEEALKKDFNIAIIGCGAYGFPLAARIKQAGKQAIHLGGATQCLFGIYGQRMLNNNIKDYINVHWIRPLPSETPEQFKKVEGGCYW